MQPSMSFSSAEGVPTLPVLIATLSLSLRTSGQVCLPLFGTPGTVYIRRASSLASRHSQASKLSDFCLYRGA